MPVDLRVPSLLPSVAVLRIGTIVADPEAFLGGGPSEKEDENLSGVPKPSRSPTLRCPDPSVDRRGVAGLERCARVMGDPKLGDIIAGEGNGEETITGLEAGGAIIPCDVSLLALARRRGRKSKDDMPNRLLKSDVRTAGVTDAACAGG